jgi:hypothetical protein
VGVFRARCHPLALAAALTLCSAVIMAATPNQLDATVQPGVHDISDFSLKFSGLDSDQLFSLNELTSFYGVTSGGLSYDTVVSAPRISGFGDANNGLGFWDFSSTVQPLVFFQFDRS